MRWRRSLANFRIKHACTLQIRIVYLITTTDGDWSDRVFQELRRYGIPPDEFWEIQSTMQHRL